MKRKATRYVVALILAVVLAPVRFGVRGPVAARALAAIGSADAGQRRDGRGRLLLAEEDVNKHEQAASDDSDRGDDRDSGGDERADRGDGDHDRDDQHHHHHHHHRHHHSGDHDVDDEHDDGGDR